MTAYIIDAQTLLVPRTAIIDDPILGKIMGDGMVKVGKDDPDYERWLPFAVAYPEKFRRADEERQREVEKAEEAAVRRRARRAELRAQRRTLASCPPPLATEPGPDAPRNAYVVDEKSLVLAPPGAETDEHFGTWRSEYEVLRVTHADYAQWLPRAQPMPPAMRARWDQARQYARVRFSDNIYARHPGSTGRKRKPAPPSRKTGAG